MNEAFNDGCALAYRVDGKDDAPVLLLSNSLGTTRELWADQVEALAGRFRIVRYDTRGHGESDAPSGDYPIEQLGGDALAVLDAAGAHRAHVCGLSLGGMTAMWLGIHAPDRIDRLILASTGARIGTTDTWNERIDQVRASGLDSIADAVMARWFTEPYRKSRPEVVLRFRGMLTSTKPQGYAGCCAALRDADLHGLIASIRAPALVVTGASDTATPPASGRAIHTSIRGAEIVELNASHLVNVEQPDRFNQVVLEFFLRTAIGSGESAAGEHHG
jgi:3-oxoadipate enol-lactonase